MSTPIQVMPSSAPAKKPASVVKEDAMWLQKEMINANYHDLAIAHDQGHKVAAGPDNPQFIVETGEGRRAAHTAGALSKD